MGSRSPPCLKTKVKQRRKPQNSALECKDIDPTQRVSRKNPGKMGTVHESPFQVQTSPRLHRPNNLECATCKPVRGQELAKKMAVSTCHVCNIYLCCACAKKHTSVKNERHFISSIYLPTTRESPNEVGTKNGHHLLVCSEQGHKDTPKYFCETCEDVICLECIENDHKKHHYLYAKDAYPKHRAVLEENVDRAHGEAIRISKKVHQAEDVLNDLKIEKEEVSKKIRQQTAKLTEALRAHEKQLLTNLDKMYAQKEETVSKNKERCQNRLDLINRTCKFTEMALNDANEVQVLVFKKYANKRLEEVCRSEILTTETKDVNLNYFTPESSTDQAKTLLGVLVDTAAKPSHCVAHGEGLSRAVVGQEASFVVTARDKRNTSLTTGGDEVRVRVSSTREKVILPRVFDLRNGKYRVTYTPKLSGAVTISVRMYDLPIKNSEFKVSAVCQRDYNKIEKPFLTIGRFSAYFTDHAPFNLPCGATVDEEGRIFVADCHNHCIKIMNREGKLIKSFGSFGNKNGQLNNPTDVAISGDKVFVCDKDNNRVQYFTPDGAFLGKFSIGCGQLKRPWGLCVDSRGHIVVLDTRNDCVQVFSEDGGFVKSFGSRGTGHCEFLQPYFAAVHKNGNIYITDNGNHRVQVFDDSYGYLFEFGNDGGELALKNPTGITVDHEGHVIVADQCNSRVQVFGQDGSWVAVISEALNYPHYQSYPKGLAVTQDGYIVVADSDNDRVVLL